MTDIGYMQCAMQEAKKSLKSGDIPVGAIIVYKDKIIARAHNQKEKNNCVFACGKLKNPCFFLRFLHPLRKHHCRLASH